MIVARWSDSIESMRASTAPGSSASSARPASSSSARLMTQSPSPSPSKTMTLRTSGMVSRMLRSFSTWVASSANAATLPESARMNATSSAMVVG